jgi:hypothetical protein
VACYFRLVGAKAGEPCVWKFWEESERRRARVLDHGKYKMGKYRESLEIRRFGGVVSYEYKAEIRWFWESRED